MPKPAIESDSKRKPPRPANMRDLVQIRQEYHAPVRTGTRSRVLGRPYLTCEEKAEANNPEDALLPVRPLTRAGCADVPRPCLFVACHHHLYADLTPAGSLKLNFPNRDPGDMPERESCALDVADDNLGSGVVLEEAGRMLNVTRERIRQIEGRAMRKMRNHGTLEMPQEPPCGDEA